MCQVLVPKANAQGKSKRSRHVFAVIFIALTLKHLGTQQLRVSITGRRHVRAHAMRSLSKSRQVINFHWPIVHSRFHSIKYYVFWTDYFCTPARSLNTPRWVITRVLPGTDRGNFVMIVGALITWAIHTQGQLLLWSSSPRDNSCCDQAWSQQELSLGMNSPGN